LVGFFGGESAGGGGASSSAMVGGEQERLLQGVSRTFALTIPELPPPLRLTVGNAYLLCRIVDTIEDEPALPASEKRRLSEDFAAIVAGRGDVEAFAAHLGALLSDRTPDWERALVAASPRVVARTRGFAPGPRAAIERCVRIMASEMSAFQERQPVGGLADLEEMGRYCYAVAGVVGELLTDLFGDYCPKIAARAPELRPLAVRFGQGLQMTNILKDVWEDQRRGVCWLPRSVFAAHGVDLGALSRDPQQRGMAEGVEELVAIAHAHLKAALSYTLLIPRQERGIRIFCLWAIGMAMLTLRRIRARPLYRDGAEVKISRRSVRATALACRVAAANDTLLRLLFAAVGQVGGAAPGRARRQVG
jgi:farnesyl-diphosphate farnesyltransferase